MFESNLDVLQEKLEIQRYAFVEASAGTGKTFAIEHLVTRLVLAGIPISRILVMTFTKAAKTELIRRIHRRLLLGVEVCENRATESVPYLSFYGESSQDTSILEAGRLLRAALQTFHEAKITTIHGFCQNLLSKYAFEADMSMAFFEAQSKEQQLENIRNYLQGYLKKDYLSPVQLQLVLASCRGQIATLIERIGERGILTDSGSFSSFQSLCSTVNESLQSIRSRMAAPEKDKILADFQALKARYNKFNTCVGQGERLADWLERGHITPLEIDECLQEEHYFWDLVVDENLNKRVAKKNEPLLLHYPFLVQALQEKISPLFQLAKNPAHILDALARGYQAYKKAFADRMETPDDLLSAMHKAVGKPRFLTKVRTEFDAAIIDEFQDTDAVQWEIFEQLFMQGRPLKALYLVGDPKQSIYAFRKADLYSYLRAREEFKLEERVHLGVNFRAEKLLVQALNALFAEKRTPGWMPLPKIQSALEVPAVAASEKAEEHSLGLQENENRKGNLHFLLMESESNVKGGWPLTDIQKNQWIPFLAKEIVHLKNMNLFPLSRIALLVKDRHQADHLMEELGQVGISTVFIRSESIVASPVFHAMLALLRVLHMPHDTYALKRFLMNPLVNASPEEIASLHASELLGEMHLLKECYEKRGLASCLQKTLKLRLFKEKTFFERLFAKSDAILYEDFLQIQEILLEELSRGERSLGQLLAFLEEIRLKDADEHKQLQRRVNETDNAVTVMTMHASKGLEFDVVFAVGLSLRSNHRDEQDVEEKDAEKMRLLYVAMTRAKRRLYVPVILDKKRIAFKPGQASPCELFFARWTKLPATTYKDLLETGAGLSLELLIENLQDLEKQTSVTWEILHTGTSRAEKLVQQGTISLPLPQKFTPFWKREEIVSFSSIFQKHKNTMPLIPKSAVTITEHELPLGAETGNLVHTLLEAIFRKSLHHPLSEDKIRALIDETIKDTPFSAYRAHLLRMVITALTLPLVPLQPDHAPFALCDVPQASLIPEMEFYYVHEEEAPLRIREWRKGFIDLFFIHKGFYYLVDWKTNCLSDYEPQQRDEAMQHHGYRLQAALYSDALQRYVKLFDIRPFPTCFGGAHYLFLRGEKWESFMPSLMGAN